MASAAGSVVGGGQPYGSVASHGCCSACAAVGLTSTTHADASPVTDDCLYYIVRAIDPCAATPDDTWGYDSFSTARPACR